MSSSLDTSDPAVTDPDRPTPTDAETPASDSRRVPRRLIAAVAVLAVLAGGLAFQQIRAADAEATANEQRQASAQLAVELGEIRDLLATPARDGQNTASALLRHQLELVAGEGPDAEVGDDLVAQLRTAADELADAATTPMPDRPMVLPVATVDPVYDRLEGLEGQAAALATVYADAADQAEAALEAVRQLEAAAVAYADTVDQLPSTDDPDAVAEAWQAERDRLADYQDTIDAVADQPAAAPLAAAHGVLVAGMGELADDALARLSDGDIDGYNALLSDRLGVDDPFGFGEALADARTEVADDAIAGPLSDAREGGLGLLTELEELRRVTPAQLAEIP